MRTLQSEGSPGDLGVAWLELAEGYHRAERRGDVIEAARATIPLFGRAGTPGVVRTGGERRSPVERLGCRRPRTADYSRLNCEGNG